MNDEQAPIRILYGASVMQEGAAAEIKAAWKSVG